MSSPYALDRSNGKMFGVCAGLARSTSLDPFLVRLGAVLLTLFALGPLGPLLYVIVAMIAESR